MFTLLRLAQNVGGKYIFWSLFIGICSAWALFHLGEMPLDPVRTQAAEQTGTQAAEALAACIGDAWSSKYIKVGRLLGDPGDHIRDEIARALPTRTNCKIIEDTLLARGWDAAMASLARIGVVTWATADSWRGKAVWLHHDAFSLLKRVKADAVVYGKVDDFRTAGFNVQLKMHLFAVDQSSDRPIFDQRFTAGGDRVLADAVPQALDDGLNHAMLRFVGWMLFVLLLPLLTSVFWKAAFEYESNLLNLAALLFLTLADALFTWTLLGFHLDTVWYKTLLGMAALAAVTWNLFALNILEDRRSEAQYGQL